jgi:nucleoside-diphosphate-sugar epimerase
VRIVVTGAAGFVGRPLCRALRHRGHSVTAVVRRPSDPETIAADRIVDAGDLSAGPDWNGLLAGAECVVHLAARTHVADVDQARAEPLYEAANVGVTESLARAARDAGVRRVVYVSSIKVNGEQTFGRPFRADDPPAPEDAYGRSKARSEDRLRDIAGSALEVVILRPPLLYGPGVRGNVAQLFRWAARGVPLPFGAIVNRRDMLGLTNFIELIAVAAASPAAAGGTFLARDGAPVSTPVLYAAIAEALGRKGRMLPVPVSALSLLGRALGRTGEVRKLVGDLEVDDAETRRKLAWEPSVSMAAELAAAAREFKS